MDFYPTNPHTLRKLLAKRQTPCTQIFKQNPSTMDNQPKDNVNFLNKAFNNRKKRDNFSLNLNSLQKRLFNSKRLHSSISSDRTESMGDSTPGEVQPNATDTFEAIHKKIKISFQESSSRKVSFDNASEQSTTCDISSEGTPNIDSHDCLSSPPLSSEPSRIIPMVRLDDENLKSSESVITNENPILVQDEPLITCPLKESFSQEKVKLRCNFRHKLKTPVSDATQIKCCKCEALLGKCQVYAAEKGGSCLNESYETLINFKCSKDHKWSVRYRNFDMDWCPECAEEKREEKREEFRKKCEDERKKRQKLEEEYQQKLFEEARRKFVNNINQRGPIIGDEDLAYFKKIDMEAEKLAKKNTEKYMSEKEASNNITFKQAFQVNKLLATPEGCLEKYMQSLDIETVKSEFRRIAKIIHPDKNKHPDAGIAFQKIHKVYEAVIGRVEGK